MSESLHRTEIGRRLRATIEALGLSQASIAKAFDVSPSKLGNWLRGDNYPAEWFVKRFCDRHGITTDWLYRGLVTGMATTLADALWKAEQAGESPVAARANGHPRRDAQQPARWEGPPRKPVPTNARNQRGRHGSGRGRNHQ